MTDQTYTVNEVAELLQMHPVTIQRHLKKGLIRGVRIGAGRWRIPLAEINRLTGVTHAK